MIDRYPSILEPVSEYLTSDADDFVHRLREAFNRCVEIQPRISEHCQELIANPTFDEFNLLCMSINNAIPMLDYDGREKVMVTIHEQMEQFRDDGNLDSAGDCKLLTVLTAYVTSRVCNLPTVVSIRNYSGHPVLFTQIKDVNYKLSYLHTGPKIDPFTDDDPFYFNKSTTREPFTDSEFQTGNQILYYDVKKAMFVLDCINLLRRAVVNYPLDPDHYANKFAEIITILSTSETSAQSVIEYWQGELDRVMYIY